MKRSMSGADRLKALLLVGIIEVVGNESRILGVGLILNGSTDDSATRTALLV